MKNVKYFTIHILLPFCLGLLLYAVFGRFFEFNSTLTSFIKYIKNIFPFVIFQMPDLLWAYSFTNALLLSHIKLYSKEINPIFYFIYIAVPLIFELGQGLKIFKGTFDYLDLIVIFVGSFNAILIFKKNDNEST